MPVEASKRSTPTNNGGNMRVQFNPETGELVLVFPVRKEKELAVEAVEYIAHLYEDEGMDASQIYWVAHVLKHYDITTQ